MSVSRRRMLMSSSGGNRVYGDFGGYMFTPGPLVYESGQFRVQETWDEVEPSDIEGLNEGSTKFNFKQLGAQFDSRGSSFSDDINNKNPLTFDGYDWVVPSISVLDLLIGYNGGDNPWEPSGTSYKVSVRPGSTVNDIPNIHWARVYTDFQYGSFEKTEGMLFFPDNKVIDGKPCVLYDNLINGGGTTGDKFTKDDINEYIDQGCIFFPGSTNYHASSSSYSASNAFDIHWFPSNTNKSLFYGNTSKGSYYMNYCYLCRNAKPFGVYILYTDGDVSPYNILTPNKTPVGVLLIDDCVSIVIHPEQESGFGLTGSISGIKNITRKAYAINHFNRGDYISDRMIASSGYQTYTNSFKWAAGIDQPAAQQPGVKFADGRIGHIPTAGEQNRILLNTEEINAAMRLIGGTQIIWNMGTTNYRSCTIYSDSQEWQYIYSGGMTWGQVNRNSLSDCRSVAKY